MRILIVGLNYAPEPTGIAPYTSAAAAALAGRGHEVRVVTGYPHYPQWEVADGYRGATMREGLAGVPVLRLRHPVPSSGRLSARIAMEAVFGLRATLSGWGRPDVVVAVSPALLASALVVARARLGGIPAVAWVQDIYTLSAAQTGTASRLGGLLRAIESATLRGADRTMVIHQRFGRFVSEELGVASGSLSVVRNWTHTAASPGRSAEMRRRLGWGEDETVVLHAGNMGAKQCLETVVHASRLAAEAGDKIRFVLLGDGNQRPRLEAMDANACLQFIDPLPDKDFEAALASADVLLVNELPGMTEMSVPSKLTSYFNTGLPVLAGVDEGSVTADEVALAQAGLRVPPADPAALLAGARRLAADPGLCAELGGAGLRHRREVLGSEAAIDAVEATLVAAARGRGGGVKAARRAAR